MRGSEVRDSGLQDNNRDGYRDGVIESEDSYNDGGAFNDGARADDSTFGREDAGRPGADRSAQFDEPGVTGAGSTPVQGANDSAGGWETQGSATRGSSTQDSAFADGSTAGREGFAGPAATGTGATGAGSPPVQGANDSARGWETQDSTFADETTTRRQDLPGSDTAEPRRSDHLTPEERPAHAERSKPGFMDKVRGKVEEIKGDDRPRH